MERAFLEGTGYPSILLMEHAAQAVVDALSAYAPGGGRVLAALGFDVGGGIRSMDCDTLTSDPSRLERADCLLVIRLSLQAEALPPSDSGAL